MNLLVRINLSLAVVFAAGGLAAVLISRTLLESNARNEILAEADLMADSALAVRTYTANEVGPLLDEQMNTKFLPQSVPFYAATQSFLSLRQKHPEYSYKEATLNPTNPRDRATDWEADIIQRFRNDSAARQQVGERDTPMGRSLYLARPIRAEAECLTCHSTPAAAPRTVVARYGSDNGFGWQLHEVIGAQVVSVPLVDAAARRRDVSYALTSWVVAIFAVTLVVVDLVLYVLVVRPIRRVSRVADRVSLGDGNPGEFPTGSVQEIDGLARSFTRMRHSLEKVMKLLDPPA